MELILEEYGEAIAYSILAIMFITMGFGFLHIISII
jgi:hypothetical protein